MRHRLIPEEYPDERRTHDDRRADAQRRDDGDRRTADERREGEERRQLPAPGAVDGHPPGLPTADRPLLRRLEP